MPQDRIARAWSAFHDHLSLNSELQRRMISMLDSPGSHALPIDLSQESRALIFATAVEIADFFRERRDYVESMATLDLAMSVEQLLRADLTARRNQQKRTDSLVAIGLLNTPPPHGQTEPSARRLLPHWRLAAGADSQLIDALDQAMQYRNWLVHGAFGNPPYALNPFLLDGPMIHMAELVKREP